MSNHPMFAARPAAPDPYLLSEGPVWDPVRERLLWVDIEQGRVHSGVLDGDLVKPEDTLEFGERVGAAAWAQDGTLLVALERTLVTVAAGGDRQELTRLIDPGVDSRLNDGMCDPAGRFVVGGMSLDGREGGECLWQVGAGTSVRVIDDDLTLSNGLGWSPDGATMYSIDSASGMVRARSYDVATGATGERRDLFHVPAASPDGMCVDAEGHLWIAVWGAGEVRRYSESGEVLATVTVPGAPHTSSASFVGPGLDLLLITTARTGLSEKDLVTDATGSGLLHTARVGVTGVPIPFWDPNTL